MMMSWSSLMHTSMLPRLLRRQLKTPPPFVSQVLPFPRRSFSPCKIICTNNKNESVGTPASSPCSVRPFRILGVQQIALGAPDRSCMDRLWKDVFGLQPKKASVTIERENVVEDIIELGPEPYAVEIDLMTPIDTEACPKVHKPPLNHFGLWVDDLKAAFDWMQGKGVRFAPGGIRTGAAGHDVAFIHPQGNDEHTISGNGVLIELVQAPQRVLQAYNQQRNNNNSNDDK